MLHNFSVCIAWGKFLTSFPSAVVVGYRGAFYGPGTGEIAFDRLLCDGTEESIDECFSLSNPPFIGPCQHSNDASVACYPESKWT